MIIDTPLRDRLVKTFRLLNTVSASRTFPPTKSLADSLEPLIVRIPPKNRIGKIIPIPPRVAIQFGTAAVDMWFRSIDSFLVSVSVTDDPIWMSTSGYYSSHYSVRGIAHLLGYFYHFGQHQLVRMEFNSSGSFITLLGKPSGIVGRSEHQVYWAIVKKEACFVSDPLFTENDPTIDASDSSHRNHANYADHLNLYPQFNLIEEDAFKDRIDKISKSPIQIVSIPTRSRFPDPNIQLIAYRRIVAFRSILNDVLVDSNKFWSANKIPRFVPEYLKFQVADNIKLII